MSHIIIRQAEPDDASHLLTYLRIIAGERDNGILMTSAEDVRWTENEERDIIRDEADLNRLREYVQNNPSRWAEDVFYSS